MLGSDEEVVSRILELKERRNAVILAHNYQLPEIQDIADFTGDSLGLSRKAAASDAKVIVFCGVDFMAETAKILSPEKLVLLPVRDAGCPLAETIDVEELRMMKKRHPRARVVCYVNSSAAIKAESDICCTSSNAVDVVNAIDGDEILFAPDQNLGNYVSRHTGKRVIVWNGYCITHHRVRVEEVLRAKKACPQARVLVHPECRPEVVELADCVTSTSGMLKYVQESEAKEFIVGTEVGLLHQLQKQNPDKVFLPLTPGLICPDMKKISSLDVVLESLESLEYEVSIPEPVRRRALEAVQRMVAIG